MGVKFFLHAILCELTRNLSKDVISDIKMVYISFDWCTYISYCNYVKIALEKRFILSPVLVARPQALAQQATFRPEQFAFFCTHDWNKYAS